VVTIDLQNHSRRVLDCSLDILLAIRFFHLVTKISLRVSAASNNEIEKSSCYGNVKKTVVL
jgi:hypothetical protein